MTGTPRNCPKQISNIYDCVRRGLSQRNSYTDWFVTNKVGRETAGLRKLAASYVSKTARRGAPGECASVVSSA